MQRGTPGPPSTADLVRIPGGTFRMGSDRHYAEEGPARAVAVDSFWMDPHLVTNRGCAAFQSQLDESLDFSKLRLRCRAASSITARNKSARIFHHHHAHRDMADTRTIVD